MRPCRACHYQHSPMVVCSVARRLRDLAAKEADAAVPPAVHQASPLKATKATKHGKYADPDKRRVYQRDLMRQRRAAERGPP